MVDLLLSRREAIAAARPLACEDPQVRCERPVVGSPAPASRENVVGGPASVVAVRKPIDDARRRRRP